MENTASVRFSMGAGGKLKISQFYFDFTVHVFRLRECL